MDKVSREGMHYKEKQKSEKKEENEKDYISLKQLNEEIHATTYSYVKILADFKKACELMGVSAESFKQGGRDYRIQKSSKHFWTLMLTSDGILKEKTKSADVYEFAKKFKETKDRLEKQLVEGDEDPYLADNWSTFVEMYYTTDAKKELFVTASEQQTIEMILACFKYMRKNVPEDRLVLYSEDYMGRIKKSTEAIVKMVEGKFWEK